MITGFGRTGRCWASTTGRRARHHDGGQGHGRRLPAQRRGLDRRATRGQAVVATRARSSSSYGGNPLAAAAGLAALEIILKEDLVENADAGRRGHARRELRAHAGEVPHRSATCAARAAARRSSWSRTAQTNEPLDKTITRELFLECLRRGLVAMGYSPDDPDQSAAHHHRGAGAREGLAILDEALGRSAATAWAGLATAPRRDHRLRQRRGARPPARLADAGRLRDRGRAPTRTRARRAVCRTRSRRRAGTTRSSRCWPHEALDFVDICTPPSSHAPLIEAALTRGLHVLCEKPLVRAPEELARLAGLARRRGAACSTPCTTGTTRRSCARPTR